MLTLYRDQELLLLTFYRDPDILVFTFSMDPEILVFTFYRISECFRRVYFLISPGEILVCEEEKRPTVYTTKVSIKGSSMILPHRLSV